METQKKKKETKSGRDNSFYIIHHSSSMRSFHELKKKNESGKKQRWKKVRKEEWATLRFLYAFFNGEKPKKGLISGNEIA